MTEEQDPFENGVPPQVQALLAHQAEQQRIHDMHAQDYRHRVLDLFQTLKEDQLGTIKHMLFNIMGESNDGSPLAAMYVGQLTMVASYRFNICAGCGVDHDKEMHQAMSGESDLPPAPTPHREAVPTPNAVNEFGDLTQADLDNMATYHLDDLRDEDTNALLGFICTGIEGSRGGCGYVYQSIDDRMLRNPETCSGCFQKAAHG